MRTRFDSHKCPDVKSWVIAAIEDESRCPLQQLWKKEPTAEYVQDERLRRIKFLRKYGSTNVQALTVAGRLEACEPKHRCLSAACPECGRLLQRWFVRRSRKFIGKHIGKRGRELIAVSIVPYDSVVRAGQLQAISIANLRRRLKYALNDTELGIALGGIDFSFNEDRDGKYQPFWSLHFYLITSTCNGKKLGDKLRKIYLKADNIPRPVKISSFESVARRRSYALKMNFRRRIGYDEFRNENGRIRNCRNTSADKLRAAERLELFIYLDKIGFAPRVIFLGATPRSDRVTIEKCCA